MKPIVYLLFLSVLWGSSFLWTKELLDYFLPTTIVFLRSLFGVLALVPFLIFSKKQFKFKVSPFFLLVVALAGAIPWNFMGFALKGIDSGLSGILNATTPLFAVLFTVLLLKVKPLKNQVFSLIIGFFAVLFLFIFSGQAAGSQFSIINALLMFGVTSSYALNSVLVNKYFSDIPPLHLGFWTLAIAVILNGPISLIIEPKALLHIGTIDVLVPLLILGCLSSGLGYVIFYIIVSISGPLLAVMVTFIVPFVAITLGFIFLDEPLHIGIAIGLPLILLSLFLMNLHTFKFRKQTFRSDLMVLKENNKIRRELFKSIEALTDDQFNKNPQNGGWSPKQIFEHLVRMETVIASSIAKELKNSDSPKAMKKPIAISTIRLVKVEAPRYTLPTDEYKTKLEMKEDLYDSHIFLLDVHESSTKEIFREKSSKHPIFGQIPLIQWFPFVALHEKRHLKQLKKTIKLILG